MNVHIDKLVKTLLKKETIEECTLQELTQFANSNPYFGAAQLLLTQKMKIENSDGYEQQLQKTFLFFNNPLWMEKLLNDSVNIANITSADTALTKIPETLQQDVSAEATSHEELNEPYHPLPITEPEKEEKVMPEEEMETEQVNTDEEENFTDEPQSVEPPIVLPAFKIEPVDPAKAAFVFEPYHTVDYFASQGIQFKEEEKPVDKFGQQLKSFTSWLKTMKRLPAAEIQDTTENTTTDKVVEMAQHSLKEGAVLTETMAEVWEKQGNSEKAIEIYEKLSLLDPSKRPYFASKIDVLKKST